MDRLKSLSGRGKAIAAGIAARLLFVLPVCWIAYVLGFAIFRCHMLAKGVRQCFEFVLVAPVVFLLPSMAYDEDPPLSTPYLLLVLFAAGISVIWTMSALMSTRRN